jgi:uncharacterized membrane protein
VVLVSKRFRVYVYAALGVSFFFIILGIWGRNKTERLGGLIILGITLCRIIFVDISGLDVIFKIITFIVLGLLFLGASYVYNRFGLDK